MNRRQSKKFRNKEKCKTYRNVRMKIILKTLDPYCRDSCAVICIVDSHKMNLKHPKSIKILNNVMPIRVNADSQNKPGQCEELNFEFNCSRELDSVIPENSIKQMLEMWAEKCGPIISSYTYDFNNDN